jgi:hypothetical protein
MGVRHHLNTDEQVQNFLALVTQGRLAGKKLCVEFVDGTMTGTRTTAQNAALHLWLTQLADALNEAGYDIKSFPWKDGIDLPWDQHNAKERLWRPVQEAMKGKESTTQCTKTEYGDIYAALTRHLANILPGFVPPPWPEKHND